MFAAIRERWEVRKALRIARDGVPGRYDDSEIVADIVVGMPQVTSAGKMRGLIKYSSHLETAFPNASFDSVMRAATYIDLLDSTGCPRRMGKGDIVYKTAADAIRRVIAEDRERGMAETVRK